MVFLLENWISSANRPSLNPGNSIFLPLNTFNFFFRFFLSQWFLFYLSEVRTKPLPQQVSGGIPGFKWRRWSNGSKNQNPQNPLDQKLTPPPPKLLDKTTHHQDYSVKIKQTKKYLPDFSFSKRIPESLEIRSTSTGVSFPKFLNRKFCLWRTS